MIPRTGLGITSLAERQTPESERKRVKKLRWDLMLYITEGVALFSFFETLIFGRLLGPLLVVSAGVWFVVFTPRETWNDENGNEYAEWLPAARLLFIMLAVGITLSFLALFEFWWPVWWGISLPRGEMYVFTGAKTFTLPGAWLLVRCVLIVAPIVIWMIPTLIAYYRLRDEAAWPNRRNLALKPAEAQAVHLTKYGGIEDPQEPEPDLAPVIETVVEVRRVIMKNNGDIVGIETVARPEDLASVGISTERVDAIPTTWMTTAQLERLAAIMNERRGTTLAGVVSRGVLRSCSTKKPGDYNYISDTRAREIQARFEAERWLEKNGNAYILTEDGAEILAAYGYVKPA